MFSRLILHFIATARLSSYFAAVVLIGAAPIPLQAQQAPPVSSPQANPPAAPQPVQPEIIHLKDYSKPRPAFPHLFQPYMPQELPHPGLNNSPRIGAAGSISRSKMRSP